MLAIITNLHIEFVLKYFTAALHKCFTESLNLNMMFYFLFFGTTFKSGKKQKSE